LRSRERGERKQQEQESGEDRVTMGQTKLVLGDGESVGRAMHKKAGSRGQVSAAVHLDLLCSCSSLCWLTFVQNNPSAPRLERLGGLCSRREQPTPWTITRRARQRVPTAAHTHNTATNTITTASQQTLREAWEPHNTPHTPTTPTADPTPTRKPSVAYCCLHSCGCSPPPAPAARPRPRPPAQT
jgi:hypothetical protein